MIPFIEKTWVLWWIVAVVIILRWSHLFLSNTGAVEVPASSEEKAISIASGGPPPAAPTVCPFETEHRC